MRRHIDEGIPLTRLAAESGIPIRTIRHWMSRYRDGGTVASLERLPRNDRGKREIAQELIDAVEGLALRRTAPTAVFIHRRIADIASARGIPAPSYSTVRALVAGIDPGLRVLAQEGDTAYRDTFELVYRRTAGSPKEQWQADHTLLDIEVLDPKAAVRGLGSRSCSMTTPARLPALQYSLGHPAPSKRRWHFTKPCGAKRTSPGQ